LESAFKFILTLILLFITAIQGIYSNIPKTNRVSRAHACNVAAFLRLHFVVYVMSFPVLNVLYIYISNCRSMCADYYCYYYYYY